MTDIDQKIIIKKNNSTVQTQLTAKQLKFIHHYVEYGDLKAAVLHSNYANTSAGYTLLRNPLVQNEIKRRQLDRDQTSNITFEWKLNVLKEIIQAKDSHYETKMRAIQIMNTMQGHNAETKHVQVNIETTLDRIEQAKRQYKEY